MTIETEVAALTVATNALLAAVASQSSTIDQHVSDSATSATASGTSATAAATSATAAATSATAAYGSANSAANSAASASTHDASVTAGADAAVAAAATATGAATSATASATGAATSATTATNASTAAATSATAANASAVSIVGSVTAATAQAALAATSATSAATSQTGAGTSATNAAASADTATSQAAIATAKAVIATTQATTATTGATSATNSATAAASSATDASNSAGASSSAANAATVSATSAAGSATTATTKAGIATAQATIATTEADIATGQAVTATTQATNAAASADTATTQATNSASSAATATAQAVIATTKAASAATSETNAATSAAAASGSATNAGNSATASSGSATASATSATASAASSTTAATSATASAASAQTASDAVVAVNAPGISTSSLTLSPGAKNFTIQSLKNWIVGQQIDIVRTSAPTASSMYGTITAYNQSTGAISVNVSTISDVIGTGTFTDWTISVSGSKGATGPQPWTAPEPWAASTVYTATAPATSVTYGGESYVCSVAHTSAATFNAANFTKIAAKGIDGSGSVSSVTGVGSIASTGGANPVISISAADASNAGSMSAADFTKLSGVAAGATANGTGTVSGTSSGTNTGDNATNTQYSALVSNAVHTGDATGGTALTLATVNSDTGSFGSASAVPVVTVNAKGLVTAVSTVAITPAAIGAQPAGSYAPSTTGNATGIVKSTSGTGALTTAVAADFPTLNQSTTGNAATVTTNADLTGDVTSVGNATTLGNAPVIAKVLTGFSPGAGAVTPADSILIAFNKVAGNIGLLTGAVIYQGNWNASTNTPAFVSGVGTKGYLYKVATAGTTTIDGISQWNVGDSIVFDGTTWDKIDGIANEVLSVAGRTGAVTLANSDVGLGNVDNTSDANKPVSAAQATALALKETAANKNTSGGYAGLTLFKLNLRNAANTFTSFFTNAATAVRTWTMPDKDGTVAMTSDITGTNSGTNTGDQTLASLGAQAALVSGTNIKTINAGSLLGSGDISIVSRLSVVTVANATQTALDGNRYVLTGAQPTTLTAPTAAEGVEFGAVVGNGISTNKVDFGTGILKNASGELTGLVPITANALYAVYNAALGKWVQLNDASSATAISARDKKEALYQFLGMSDIYYTRVLTGN